MTRPERQKKYPTWPRSNIFDPALKYNSPLLLEMDLGQKFVDPGWVRQVLAVQKELSQVIFLRVNLGQEKAQFGGSTACCDNDLTKQPEIKLKHG